MNSSQLKTSARKLSVIMFTDIVGYTALMGKDANKALELVHKSVEIQKPLVSRHNGKWLKEMGDGAMAQFSSALDAVNCATEIQRSSRINFGAEFRIGIHLGDITIEGNDVYGDGVNVAARLESIADPGGIYISESVEKAIRGHEEVQCKYLGECNLKNVNYGVRTYAVQGEGLPVPSDHHINQISNKNRKKRIFKSIWFYLVIIFLVTLFSLWKFGNFKDVAEAEITSLAVLPFDNFTGDSGQDYFSAGLHDNLITALSQISSLDIISKTSTLKYKDTDMSIPDIAKELGVDAIIEASILQSVDSIRLNVQLIQASPVEKHLWAQIFDRPVSNVFYLLDDITQTIAKEINLSITDQSKSTTSSRRIIDNEALNAYYRGLFNTEKLSPEGSRAALDYFDQSIKIDSTFAPAYAGISLTWIFLLQMRQATVAEAIPKIYEYNQRALELDEDFADTQYLKALMSFQGEWNWPKSEEAFKKAISVNPNHALAHAFYSHLLMIQKRFDEAIVEGEKSVKLDPNNSLALSLYAIVLWHAGNIEQAISISQKSLELNPGSTLTFKILASTNHLKGNYDKSMEILGKVHEGDRLNFEEIKNENKEHGYKPAMEKLAQLLEKQSQNQAFQIATYYNRADKYDKAIEWLERGLDNHDVDMPYAFLPAELNNLRSDPRYADLAKKMNLPF